jgi:hypothetical protein
MKIAVDFDGTIVENKFPGIGREKIFAFRTLRELQRRAIRLFSGHSVPENNSKKPSNSAAGTDLNFMPLIKVFPKRNLMKPYQGKSMPIFLSMTGI